MYNQTAFPVIDLAQTGRSIERHRRDAGLTVRDLQTYFGFEYPQAIYKWQHGECLPTVDNLLALARLLQVSMEDLLVYEDQGVSHFLSVNFSINPKQFNLLLFFASRGVHSFFPSPGLSTSQPLIALTEQTSIHRILIFQAIPSRIIQNQLYQNRSLNIPLHDDFDTMVFERSCSEPLEI